MLDARQRRVFRVGRSGDGCNRVAILRLASLSRAVCTPPDQYWFYYAGSATAEGRVIDDAIRELSTAIGKPTFHPDDWEWK